MRAELAEAVGTLLEHAAAKATLRDEDSRLLLAAADLVSLARTRSADVFRQNARAARPGALAVGIDQRYALEVAMRVRVSPSHRCDWTCSPT